VNLYDLLEDYFADMDDYCKSYSGSVHDWHQWRMDYRKQIFIYARL